MDNVRSNPQDEVDVILSDIGEFRRFQIVNFILLAIPIALGGAHSVSYIFTATPLDYRFVGRVRGASFGCSFISDDFRCQISECDNLASGLNYEPSWLPFAIPFKNDRPQKCLRFASTFRNDALLNGDECPVEYFNRTQTVKCDDFVFKTDEVNILNEFGIFCEEKEFQLALVGTVNSVGRFIFTLVSGFVSDR